MQKWRWLWPILMILILLVFVQADKKDKAAGVVTICFDDARDNVFTMAFPELAYYNLPATLFVIPGAIQDQPSWHLSWPQIKILAANSWEIASHSQTHPHLTRLRPEEVEKELRLSKQTLEEHGFLATSFAPPYGEFNEAIAAQVKKYYGSLRGTERYLAEKLPSALNSLNDRNVDPYQIAAIELYYEFGFETTKKIIVQAVKEGKWAVFYLHGITPDHPVPADYLFNLFELRKMVKYLHEQMKQGRLKVMTISGFLATRG